MHMCRMLGIVASEPTDFRICLREAPRSLGTLSREHPHGWGVAVFAGSGGWTVQKQPRCADEDAHFGQVACGSRGEVLVAHVRKRTVGPISLENTHPFRRGDWVFAHNGTVEDQGHLRRASSGRRLQEVTGQTDSELLFSYVLTRLDEANPSSVEAVSGALRRLVDELVGRPNVGAVNFLLSNGEDLFAYRYGRTLFVLERSPHDELRPLRESAETGAVVETRWTRRRRAVLVASERLTDEPWRVVEEGTLLHVGRRPEPRLRVLSGAVEVGPPSAADRRPCERTG